MISTSAYKDSKVLWKWKSQINSWRYSLPGILSLPVAKPKLRRGDACQSGGGSRLSPITWPPRRGLCAFPGCKQWWIFPCWKPPVCSWPPAATLLRVRRQGMCWQAVSLLLLLVSDVASVSDMGQTGRGRKLARRGRRTGKTARQLFWQKLNCLNFCCQREF